MTEDEPHWVAQRLVDGAWQQDPDPVVQSVVADFVTYVGEYTKAVAQAREQACEAAVQTGECGVLETIDRTQGQFPTHTFDVTRDVPYGELWEVEITIQ